MLTGHDIDFLDRTPEILDTAKVFRTTMIKKKALLEHDNIVPHKSAEDTNIPTSLDEIHFLSDTHFWHSWQLNVIKKSPFVKQESTQRQIKRFLRKENVSLQCEVNTLQEQLQVMLCLLCIFTFCCVCI